MRIKKAQCAIGVLCMVASLWIAGFLCATFPATGNYGFAAFSTGAILIIFSLAIIFFAVAP